MSKILADKHLSLLLVGFYYLVAFILALFITVSLFNLSITNQNLIGLVTFLSELNKMGIAYSWWFILTWHISATIIIFIFSKLHNNSSIYDPFWHVAPIPIVIFMCFDNYFIYKDLLVIFPFLFWSLRLTYNWYKNWQNLYHEDFRYIDLKNNNKLLAFINDFFGIHLIPTLIVNLALFPISLQLEWETEFSFTLVLASVFTSTAVILQAVADEQMRTFRADKNNVGKTMNIGLWKYSRHPNYLGEVLFWFGIYFIGLSAMNLYWMLICPTIMLMLFVFISCPMMDNRSLKRRPDYREYMNSTSQLFLWFPMQK